MAGGPIRIALRKAFKSQTGSTEPAVLCTSLIGTAIGTPLIGLIATVIMVQFIDHPQGLLRRFAIVVAALPFSVLLAWVGFIPLYIAAFVLIRFGVGGWLTFALTGAAIGFVIGLTINEFTFDPESVTAPFAPVGAVYALVFRCIYGLLTQAALTES